MQKLPYIKLFSSLFETAREMTDDEAGRLFKAILQYAYGEEPSVGGAERYVYLMLKSQIDRDVAAYEEISEKNSENGKRGGRPKNSADENRPLLKKATAFQKTDRFQNEEKKPTAFKKSDRFQEEEEDKEEDKEKEYIGYDDDDDTRVRAREDNLGSGSGCSPGVVAYIDANIGNLTAGNYDELSALMDEGITDELVRYAVDEAVKNGARNAGYVFGILERLRDNGIKSAGDAKRAAEEFRRKRDAGAGRGKIPFSSADKRTSNDFSQRTVTDDEFENGFYTDVMNLSPGGDSK